MTYDPNIAYLIGIPVDAFVEQRRRIAGIPSTMPDPKGLRSRDNHLEMFIKSELADWPSDTIERFRSELAFRFESGGDTY